MVAKILDGKAAADAWRAELVERISRLPVPPSIALVRVGDDAASGVYVTKKEGMCRQLGIRSQIIHLPASTTQAQLLSRIDALNADKNVHAILVQVPLPPQIDAIEVQKAIQPFKDVDGFGPKNLGFLLMGRPRLVAATPAGVMRLLSHYKLDVAGKHCVVVGRSNIVGKPLAQLLLNADATVTLCHSRTHDLSYFTKQADFLFCAVGKPGLISAKMVKKGAVVVDVGTSKSDDGKLSGDAAGGARLSPTVVGDVDFNGVKKVASYLSPVPGGVGPMTIMSLMANTIAACERQLSAHR